MSEKKVLAPAQLLEQLFENPESDISLDESEVSSGSEFSVRGKANASESQYSQTQKAQNVFQAAKTVSPALPGTVNPPKGNVKKPEREAENYTDHSFNIYHTFQPCSHQPLERL
uniref:Uncharacterized protein n=1 Tax=Knipowitschia caucasica TaxID=637954 RepID=A0AAV2LHZ6_KNICA